MENVNCLLLKTLIEEVELQMTFLSVFNIFMSFAAVLGNVVIIDALSNDFFCRSSSKFFFRCLATTDICVGVILEPLTVCYWLSMVKERWNHCHSVVTAIFVIGNITTTVSLMTVTAIIIDRLLALQLGLRYKHVVTSRRIHITIAAFWIISSAATVISLLNFLAYLWYVYVVIALCLVTSSIAFAKLFCTLCGHQNQILSSEHQTTSLNLIRLKKEVSTAFWVKLTMVVCYLPHVIVGVVSQMLQDPSDPISSTFFITKASALTLFYLNSSLNPILYFWKIKSIRHTAKTRFKKLLFVSSRRNIDLNPRWTKAPHVVSNF